MSTFKIEEDNYSPPSDSAYEAIDNSMHKAKLSFKDVLDGDGSDLEFNFVDKWVDGVHRFWNEVRSKVE